jgi:excinuclease ABC subunit C
VEGQDDCAMMAEVVCRYFAGLAQEKKGFPDLVLIDGGKGQLSAALYALSGLGMEKQDVVALAKRLDEVFLPQRSDPLMIPKGSASLKLLKKIRDEAHRFAVEYHRKLRKKRIIRSELDQIPGVGPARRASLLKHFGSVAKIREANSGELVSLQGINKRVAENIYNHFHP